MALVLALSVLFGEPEPLPFLRNLTIALLAAARGAESAVQSHVHRARSAGATAQEIEHAVLVGINTLGFASMMTALSWVKDALKE